MAKSKSEGDLEFVYRPRSDSQRVAEELWRRSRVLFFVGGAGTGKTTCAMGMAIRDALQSLSKETHNRHRLWLARPQVACGEEMGFLPGDLENKILPWHAPFADCFESLSAAQFSTLEKKLKVENVSVGMLRGRTIRGPGTLIVDEAQQLNRLQLVCILTRIGEGARIVLCGDPAQSDRYDPKKSPLLEAARKLDGLDCVSTVRFTEQLRDPLVTQILDRL